jgi:hypothetical protein
MGGRVRDPKIYGWGPKREAYFSFRVPGQLAGVPIRSTRGRNRMIEGDIQVANNGQNGCRENSLTADTTTHRRRRKIALLGSTTRDPGSLMGSSAKARKISDFRRFSYRSFDFVEIRALGPDQPARLAVGSLLAGGSET